MSLQVGSFGVRTSVAVDAARIRSMHIQQARQDPKAGDGHGKRTNTLRVVEFWRGVLCIVYRRLYTSIRIPETMFLDPPLSWALGPECKILLFIRSCVRSL